MSPINRDFRFTPTGKDQVSGVGFQVSGIRSEKEWSDGEILRFRVLGSGFRG